MHDTKVTLIWHRKSTVESTKMEKVDQLLLQAAYLEDISYKWCCCTSCEGEKKQGRCTEEILGTAMDIKTT